MRESTAAEIADELAHTTRRQADAADPTASVWVSANAGTGKTHVLTMRVLRLMLAGTAPERILCLTYTKAAAAEMSKRVFERLSEWVLLPKDKLTTALTDFIGSAPTSTEIDLARTLFTRATETPGGLRVQTIHAFSERLLQRFPLEAGVTPGFAILDDETARSLRRDAIDDVLALAARDRSTGLGRALQAAIAYAADQSFDDILTDALSHRDWLSAANRMPAASEEADAPDGLAATRAVYERHFGVRPGVTRTKIANEIAKLLSPANITHIIDVLMRGGKMDAKLADPLREAAAAGSDIARAEALSGFFLKSTGEPRDKFLSKKLAEENSELPPIIDRAQARFLMLWEEMRGADVVEATMALIVLASEVLQRYQDAKIRRAALDFDDLIEKTKSLLADEATASWVLFKLDNGIDHILVDESQDTSPAQWNIVKGLAAEFFAGSDKPRTVFAVGDEKQSIYSFQGAAPKMFADAGEHFRARAEQARVPWRPIPLNLSFRTVAPVLAAVDQVFADPSRTPGVPAAIRHIAKRFGHAGLVEIWPSEPHVPGDPGDAWSPLEEASASPPVVRVANRIADEINAWLATGEVLASTGRPIAPGDILILVRKRQPFAASMVQALKARGIPVAGADRMRLAEQIAVEDLLSLGDFLTLPENDLALAEVLKSPMFGFSDDDLLAIAPGRKGTLWKALLDSESMGGVFETAARTLKRWRKAADFRPPFEFFADLLDRDGMREKLIARLGPDATDPLDEFLNLALTYDDRAPPSLSGFLAFMRDDERMIKRDMEHGRNEVRVMTAHGAKGLEAPIVFLPDTAGAGSAGRQGGRPIKVPGLAPPGTADAFVWPVKGTSRIEALRAARETIETAEREEYHRLLYVAMTRARDRLYVTAFEGKRGLDKGCWYELIRDGLAGDLEKASGRNGAPLLRLATAQNALLEAPKFALAERDAPVPLPPWAKTNVPREPQLTVPLAPSRMAPYDTDDEGEPKRELPPKDPRAEPAPLAATAPSDANRFLRGTLTHALLEHLPCFEPKVWSRTAKAFLAARAGGLPARTQKSIADEVQAILTDPAFGAVFGPASRAEVPVAAVIPRPNGTGPALRITGQIDRLVELEKEVLIIDYKTNRSAPAKPEDVAPVYLYQLAAYRLALAEIFKTKPVSAALLWTDGARLMPIPAATLDSYAALLWQLDVASLDA